MESPDTDLSRPGAETASPASGAQRNRAPAAFDVFISYNSTDRPLVTRVVRHLKRKNVNPWFDEWNLTPGGEWQEEMAAGLLQSSACAVFIGKGDLRSWARLEMSVALNRAATERAFRVFPVLLPGLEPFEPADLPPFLATRKWVDLRDGPESERRLQDLINAVHGVPFGADVRPDQENGPAPYQGLEAFDERHARYYFGREAYVQRLIEKLKGSRFVAVVGPSGCGKSSLVRAGLLPRLRAGGTGASWSISVLRPGAHPLAALAGQLNKLGSSLTLQSTVDQLETDERTVHLIMSAALADEPPDRQVLIVVDQGEELFTLCQDAAARTGFMNALHYASAVPGGRTVVVLTVRADFYARLAEFPQLAQLAQSHQLLIGGLSDDELRQVIEEPARVAGLEIEPGLVETVLADVVREPGALPLLEHALLETWRRRRGRVLTLEGYQESGGVRRGLAERAEALYGELTPEGQDAARRLLLRLTQPGEGTEDTRRRTNLREVSTGPDRESVEEVVRRFVAGRLLVTSADEVTGEQRIEVAHEAVTRGWPRLQRWIDEDRAGLLVHRRLTFAAQEWHRLGRDAGVLYSGSRLAEALVWRDRQPDRLNRVEDDFLQVSAKAEHDSRTARRRRLAVAFVALIAALTVISGVALVAVERGNEAARQRDLAISGRLAAGAVNALTVDPSLSLALALRAMDTARTAQAEEVLRRAVDEARGVLVLRGDGGAVLDARFLPGPQRRVVTASDDGRLRVWDLDSAKVVATMPVHTDRAFVVRASPDGKRVASAGRDGVVAVTELTSGTSRVVFRASPAVRMRGVAFSPDGKLLAAAASDGTVRLLDADSGRKLTSVDAGKQPVNDVAFSRDARVIAIAGEDGSAQVRLASNGALQARLDGHHGAVASVRFNPAGTRVLTGGADGTARLWDPGTGDQVAVFQVAKETLFSADFDPDGERIVTAGWDGTVRVWDLDGPELAALRGHQDYAFDATFDRTGDLVLSAGQDGTVRLWRLDRSRAARSAITGTSFGPDGRIVTGGADGHVRVWDAAPLQVQHDFAVTAERHWASFSADGRRLVTAGENGDVQVMDADSGHELARLRPHSAQVWAAALDPTGQRVISGGEDGRVVLSTLSGAPPVVLGRHSGPVYSVQFSPDGKSILSGGAGGAVRLWDLNGGVAEFTGHDGDVLDVAFSRDGSRLASAGADGTVRIWDRTERRQTALLRGHEGAATSVRFNPDGQRVATTGEDGTIKVWDATSARLLLTRQLFQGSGSAVDFSKDGAVIVSASEADGVLRTSVCEVCGPVDQVLALARSRPVRTLTPEEEQRFAY